MERDENPRVVKVPPDLARALKANRAAKAAWDRLGCTHRQEYTLAVTEARKPETRVRRVEKTIAELSAGKR
ncbi:MAG: YdeI/OmpD-associated family protein [Chloroflexi bacterium]|nr:YdeI/OmpD-associated family protein [Chloroflexota bacterium]